MTDTKKPFVPPLMSLKERFNMTPDTPLTAPVKRVGTIIESAQPLQFDLKALEDLMDNLAVVGIKFLPRIFSAPYVYTLRDVRNGNVYKHQTDILFNLGDIYLQEMYRRTARPTQISANIKQR